MSADDMPLEVVRLNELRKFIPVGKTRRDELIASGALECVPITPSKDGVIGRAKAVTMRSIRAYQERVMGIKGGEQ